jgi:membrane associated rhomboid family serine protease
MGIYDRDYYRREGPSVIDWLFPSGNVCKWLIGINFAVFVVQLMTRPADPSLSDLLDQDRIRALLDSQLSGGWFTELFLLNPTDVMHGQVWRLLTYAFLHSPDDYTHIVFNMLFLWWFGSELEQLYGEREFLLFYLTSALLGGIAYTAVEVVAGRGNPCLGASGAITALLVLFALHFPHRMILVMFFLPVPVWLFALFNVAQDLFNFLGRRQTGVAVVVHLGGAVTALLYYKQSRTISGFLSRLSSWRRKLRQPRLKVYRPETDEPREPVPVAAPAGGPMDEHFEARLDAVLEKIARSGKESLSADEQRILLQASELYKKKRS